MIENKRLRNEMKLQLSTARSASPIHFRNMKHAVEDSKNNYSTLSKKKVKKEKNFASP